MFTKDHVAEGVRIHRWVLSEVALFTHKFLMTPMKYEFVHEPYRRRGKYSPLNVKGECTLGDINIIENIYEGNQLEI